MIKFWKSAAKGKSGCPVRPPEPGSGSSFDVKTLLSIQARESTEDVEPKLFSKKSKLTLTLHDILVRKVALHYLIQYMESIGKHLIIECWLELNNFNTLVTNNCTESNRNNCTVIRTKSLDIYTEDKGQEYLFNDTLWKNNDMQINRELKLIKMDNSTNSCGNLSNNTISTDKFENLKQIDPKDVTNKAITLFKTYVALEAPLQLDLPDHIRKSVISDICHPEGQIKEDCFKPVLDIVYRQIEDNYYNDFQRSPFYIKAQIDVLSCNSLNLEDIIYNETILFYFTEYLEQESCRILLEFLMAVSHFRENLINDKSVDSNQAQADAIIIYDKYFSLQALSPIGFPTDIRLQVESDICKQGGPPPNCFDLPYQIVFKTLSCYVKTFLESEIYYKYLSEMIHSVNLMSSSHKSHSDCSSEFSISTQNTLLAMGDPYCKKKRNNSVPDMTIDSNQLYNADALWQRKRHDGLTIGRINSLGRFESKFEPDPDKKQKSVLKKMVSRFVPSNQSKVEEEMAWQIAHMIVKDVTDLTMAPPDNDRDNV